MHNTTVHHDWIIDSMTIKKKEYENLKQRFQKTLFTYSYLRNIKNLFDDLDDEEFDEEEYEVALNALMTSIILNIAI